ncbi:hypothetical protein [Streptomyces sp. B6B3]|uniref:hypothetical protein n=1 Tax=Streptomyces sp. B6B3 TaxID=3153570 RepID=UPI00325D5DFD
MRDDPREESTRTPLSVISSMARREAAALLRHPRLETWVTHPAVTVSLRTVPCPWPGCRAPRTQAGLLPIASAEPLGRGERPRAGSVTLTALSCEWLAARSLWPLAQGAATGRAPGAVLTRAAALVRLLGHGPPDGWVAALPELDARERWLDEALGLADGGPAPEGRAVTAVGAEPVLPASSRGVGLAQGRARHAVRAPGGEGHPTAYASHLISPHLAGGRTDSLNDAYLRCRMSAVAAAFERTGEGRNSEGRNGG